jgi:hypothetical protein
MRQAPCFAVSEAYYPPDSQSAEMAELETDGLDLGNPQISVPSALLEQIDGRVWQDHGFKIHLLDSERFNSLNGLIQSGFLPMNLSSSPRRVALSGCR